MAASVHFISSNQLDVLLHDNADVLSDDLGTLNSVEAKLHVQPNSVSKFHKAHSVPFSIKETLGQEIDCLEAMGILEKVDHSDQAAPDVAVPSPRYSSSQRKWTVEVMWGL